MPIQVVPALKAQRDLVALPHTMERFEAYVRTMIGPGDTVELPLFLFNPMAREHVSGVLDELLAYDAEAILRGVAREADERLRPGVDMHALVVVVDDARGGWTNRYITDFEQRFTERGGHPTWVQVLVWSSEGAEAPRFRRDALAAFHRNVDIIRNGRPRTLREMLEQEGRAALFAGAAERVIDPDDAAYSREVITPHLDSTARPVQMACLYGDVAAREVGYAPLGLSPWAGLAVAVSFVA